MPHNQSHILVVDDDDRLRDLLKRYLEKSNYVISLCHDGVEAQELLQDMQFDLIVLDVMMPRLDGVGLLKKMRANNNDTPVLLLTAKSETQDRIDGFESGADDYLAKPFEPKELDLRIRSILKRAKADEQKDVSGLTLGGYVFDEKRGRLKKQSGEIIDLTSVEATLLSIFIKKPGHVFSRYDLADMTGQDPDSRTIDVQITRLRRKIETDPKMPHYLQTVRGKGYVLRPD